MKLSEDRINFLSHKILNKISGLSIIRAQEEKILLGIRRAFHKFLELMDILDEEVKAKISTLKRGVPEGSREWDVLYRQYFDEELRRKNVI